MLIGEYQHSMDKKGRVFIPAKFREELGGKIVLCKSLDISSCLCIYTVAEYQRIMLKVNQNKLVLRNKLLRYLSSSVEVEYDAQGRVNIPPALRDFASLSDADPVMIVGTDKKIEIWSKPLWDEINSDELADELRGLVDGADL